MPAPLLLDGLDLSAAADAPPILSVDNPWVRSADIKQIHLTVPLFVVPFTIIVILLLSSIRILSKGMAIARVEAQAHEEARVACHWPVDMDADLPTASTAAERELVCAALEAAAPDDVPSPWRCPISLEVMRDPVVASDGHTYERHALRSCLASCGPVSPLTKQPLAAGCVRNHALARSMELWLTERTGVPITPPALEALLQRLGGRCRAAAPEAAAAVEAPQSATQLQGLRAMV